MKDELPQAVKVCLWSYNTDLIDLVNPAHRVRIILNVLNHGSIEAVDWLRKNFTDLEIKNTIAKTAFSEWNKKSITLWSLVFDTSPSRKSRFA